MNGARRTAISVSVAAWVATIASVASAQVKMDDVLKDALTVGDVVTIGLGPQGQRFSPISLANRETVSRIVPGWSLPLGGDNRSGSGDQPQAHVLSLSEGQPLVRDGIMYMSGSLSGVEAVDTKSGRRIWHYDHRPADRARSCCDAPNRGAALFADKIYLSTRDAKLVALNAKTGKVVWMHDIDDLKSGHAEISAPLIVPSKAHGPIVVTGMARGEFGVVGRVDARRADTGARVWSRPTIEGHLGELAGKPATMTGKLESGLPDEMWTRRGGATWLGGTYDPETKLIFVGTGAPAPSTAPPSAHDRKWSRARIAIDPETGTIRWGFQTTPNEGWNYDGVNELVAFDMGGQKVAATADRNGFFYVLDRASGRFISAFPFVSRINWAKGIDKSGRPVAEPEWGGQTWVGSTGKTSIVPGPFGGKNWMPMAYSRDTKLFYVPSNEWGQAASDGRGSRINGLPASPTPVFDTHVGSLKAIDPTSGQVVWEYKDAGPLWGGVLATAGGLVVFGTAQGELKALDALTGEPLWSRKTGGSIVSSPITWVQDGEQMFAVVSSPAGSGPLAAGQVTAATTNRGQSQPPATGPVLWTFRLPKEIPSTSN